MRMEVTTGRRLQSLVSYTEQKLGAAAPSLAALRQAREAAGLALDDTLLHAARSDRFTSVVNESSGPSPEALAFELSIIVHSLDMVLDHAASATYYVPWMRKRLPGIAERIALCMSAA